MFSQTPKVCWGGCFGMMMAMAVNYSSSWSPSSSSHSFSSFLFLFLRLVLFIFQKQQTWHSVVCPPVKMIIMIWFLLHTINCFLCIQNYSVTQYTIHTTPTIIIITTNKIQSHLLVGSSAVVFFNKCTHAFHSNRQGDIHFVCSFFLPSFCAVAVHYYE